MTRCALPREWTRDKFKQIEEGKLHPKKGRRVVTRREVTGDQISRNIVAFNSPAPVLNTDSLVISRDSSLQQQPVVQLGPSSRQQVKKQVHCFSLVSKESADSQ